VGYAHNRTPVPRLSHAPKNILLNANKFGPGTRRALVGKMSRYRLALAVLMAGGGCHCAAESSSNATRVAVERLLARYGSDNSPGCAAGVLLNHRVVFEGAAGTADGREPLSASTPLYLASVAKQFTAAAVYQLVDGGKLRLNESIRTRLPELPGSANGVTLQQLLNHTSGLRDYSALQEVAGRSGPIDNLGVLRLLSIQRQLNFAPGTDYEYSNSEYVLLGLLVERSSGVSLAEYARREIFSPAGMDRSWYQSDHIPEHEPARGYELRDGSFRLAAAPPQTIGDGGMYSSVSDLLRWMGNLERPTEIGKAVMRQIQSRARLRSGEALPHASGLFWNRYQGRVTISHNGVVPGFQADTLRFPREHLSVACLCNRGDVNAASLSRQIAGVFLGTSSSGAREPAVAAHPASGGLVGKWESRQGFILSTNAEGDRLRASLAGTEYLMSAGPKRTEFSAKSDGFRMLLRRRSADVVQMGWEGDRPNSFRRIHSTVPGPSELGQYAGRFLNEDLNVKWDLALIDGALVITTDAGWRIPLTAIAQNRFEVGPWLLEFRRDGGSISGFTLHRERLWALRFEKTGAPDR
jgi:CubicO group peptidase (beta-lactamase class C family)